MLKRCSLIVLVVAGCKKEPPPPSCDQITDHMLEVTKQALPGHDPSELGDRKAMIAQCEKRNLTREQRNCLMKAATLPALGDCTPKNAVPTKTPANPAPSPSPPTAPTGSASP